MFKSRLHQLWFVRAAVAAVAVAPVGAVGADLAVVEVRPARHALTASSIWSSARKVTS